MLDDNNSPFFAILVQCAIFSTVKVFPSKDVFGCSHCPIHPHNDMAFCRLVVEQSTWFYAPFVKYTWYVFTKSTDCYDFTGCEIITNLERLPSSHCPFKKYSSKNIFVIYPETKYFICNLSLFTLKQNILYII